jgi:hypothetical protein
MGKPAYEFSENIMKDFLSAKKVEKSKKMFVDFRINRFIRFQEDNWDFNYLNKYNRDPRNYRFDFNSIPFPYRYYVKIIILNEMLYTDNEFGSIKKEYQKLTTITRTFYQRGLTDIRQIDDKSVKEYINECLEKRKPSYVEKLTITIRKILCILEDNTYLSFSNTIQFLKEVGSNCAKEKPESTINEYIPDAFLNQLISLAVKDIENINLSIDARIFACLLIILAETGMRAEELSLLQTNRMRSIKFEDNEANYLTFYTFKTTETKAEAKETYTYMSPLASKAYKIAEMLVKEILDGKYSNIKETEIFKKVIPLMEAPFITKSVKNPSNEKSNFIFISSHTGKLRRGTAPLREHFQRFIIRHFDTINLGILSKKDLAYINFFKIEVESKYKKFFTVKEREKIPFEEVINLKYPHVNLHRFRVTVCSKLFRQKVHIDYILKHMNHLSEDMTNYYNKSQTFKDRLKESIEILKSIANKEGLLETDSNKILDEFMKSEIKNEDVQEKFNKVNDFLKHNKLNIQTDIKRILQIMEKTNSTIAENDFGMCLRSLMHGLCERKRYFSSMTDRYFIGIQLQNYKFLDYNYERFKQKLVIVNHNKKISEKNDQFLNEFQREEKALKGFVTKTLKTEIGLLEKDLNISGEKSVLDKYPRLSNVLKNLDRIKREIKPWIVL